MPQIVLPIFPSHSTPITQELSFEKGDGLVCYSNGMFPVFQHEEADTATFRFYTSSLIGMGAATPGQIVAAFGVPLITVRRYYKVWREQGASGFYAPRPAKRGNRLTPELLIKAQAMLDSGKSGPETARMLNILPNTVNKAVQAGRLKKAPRTRRRVQCRGHAGRPGGALARNARTTRCARAMRCHLPEPAHGRRWGSVDGHRHHPTTGASRRLAGGDGRCDAAFRSRR